MKVNKIIFFILIFLNYQQALSGYKCHRCNPVKQKVLSQINHYERKSVARQKQAEFDLEQSCHYTALAAAYKSQIRDLEIKAHQHTLMADACKKNYTKHSKQSQKAKYYTIYLQNMFSRLIVHPKKTGSVQLEAVTLDSNSTNSDKISLRSVNSRKKKSRTMDYY